MCYHYRSEITLGIRDPGSGPKLTKWKHQKNVSSPISGVGNLHLYLTFSLSVHIDIDIDIDIQIQIGERNSHLFKVMAQQLQVSYHLTDVKQGFFFLSQLLKSGSPMRLSEENIERHSSHQSIFTVISWKSSKVRVPYCQKYGISLLKDLKTLWSHLHV